VCLLSVSVATLNLSLFLLWLDVLLMLLWDMVRGEGARGIPSIPSETTFLKYDGDARGRS